MAAALVAWLITYALHSTVLLGVAALVSRSIANDSWRETLWKSALVGGMLTATLPLALGYTPLVGRWSVDEVRQGAAAQMQATSVAPVEGQPAAARPEVGLRGGMGAELGAESMPEPGTAFSPAAWRSAAETGISWTYLLLASWVGIALVLLGRLAVDHVRLFAALRNRRPIADGPLAAMVADIRRRAGFWTPVRLSVSSACPTPIALGRAEVCVPDRFVDGLDVNQQRAALAHEIAHLKRRDPIWQLAAGLMESVFFFQPLHRLARLRLRETAEHLCDDWAVRQIGSSLDLARCLADVASWIGGVPVPERTLAMAEGGSPLLRRIERLVEWRDASNAAAGVRLLTSATLLACVAILVPAFTGATAPAVRAATTSTMAPAVRAQFTPDSVVRHPDPSRPLAARWEWAMERSFPGGFWAAWEIETAAPMGQRLASSSSRKDGMAAPALSDILNEPADGNRVALIFGFETGPTRDARVRRVSLRRIGDATNLQGRPLVWLGSAGAQESLALLHRLYGALSEPVLRREVAAAYTLHSDAPEVLGAIRALLRREVDPKVRSEAVQWLARLHTGEGAAVDLVAGIAAGDSSEMVQQEAVDALGIFLAGGAAGAHDALVRIAETHPNWGIRSEAVQILASKK